MFRWTHTGGKSEGRVEKMLLTVSEAAAALGMGRSFVYQLVTTGELPSVKLGKNRRVPVVELEKYVQRLLQQGAAA